MELEGSSSNETHQSHEAYREIPDLDGAGESRHTMRAGPNGRPPNGEASHEVHPIAPPSVGSSAASNTGGVFDLGDLWQVDAVVQPPVADEWAETELLRAFDIPSEPMNWPRIDIGTGMAGQAVEDQTTTAMEVSSTADEKEKAVAGSSAFSQRAKIKTEAHEPPPADEHMAANGEKQSSYSKAHENSAGYEEGGPEEWTRSRVSDADPGPASEGMTKHRPALASSSESVGGGAKKPAAGAKSAGGSESQERNAETIRRRNRDHARNTRMRQKAYVAQLEQTVQNLESRNKNQELWLRSRAAAMPAPQIVVPQAIPNAAALGDLTLEFLRLFFSGEADLRQWVKVMNAQTQLVSPVSPFRTFNPCTSRDGKQHLDGILKIVEDGISWSVFLRTIGCGSAVWCAARRNNIVPTIEVKLDQILPISSMLYGRWQIRTTNLVQCGAARDCDMSGMIRATFEPAGGTFEGMLGTTSMPQLWPKVNSTTTPLTSVLSSAVDVTSNGVNSVNDQSSSSSSSSLLSGGGGSAAGSNNNSPPTYRQAAAVITSVELVYDVMAFMQQVHRAAAGNTSGIPSIIPNASIVSLDGFTNPQMKFDVLSTPTERWPISSVNQAWQECYGYTSSEVVGRPMGNLFTSHSTAKDETLNTILEHMQVGRASAGVCRLRSKNHGSVLIHMSVYPLWNTSTSQICNFLGIPVQLEMAPCGWLK
uniref:PAS domain-containing protein n=1 Tax=Octactis speculum TaxID=3111310 RepID=A0A7S2B6B9_9STRA|mmetsp:Transcript_20045/g.27178  ORF Transcript_20045/g.27178 Transcript_20045/m.27178 type:complete len:705 (+) Transcript_20045:120-2234(+)